MNMLTPIIERKKSELLALQQETPEDTLRAKIAAMPPPRSFVNALSRMGGQTRIIAEIKRASPSRGDFDPLLDAAAVAREYAESGAAALSVLTDAAFNGALRDLRNTRMQIELPIMRKDFIIDPYQLLESRAAGADAILLIAAVLTDVDLVLLHERAHELQMDAVVEVHDEAELRRALALPQCTVVGINNRGLTTFEVDLTVCERLVSLTSDNIKVIAESGIRNANDIRRLRECGLANFLVGEALMCADRRSELLRQLREA